MDFQEYLEELRVITVEPARAPEVVLSLTPDVHTLIRRFRLSELI